MKTVDKIVMTPIEKIVPYEKNPRRNSKTVELLCKVIPKVGFNVPLVLDKENVIVKGHARYLAAKKLGLKEVPCVISNADPEAIRADRIADNKVFEFSKWLDEELLHEVDMLDLGFDVSEFGLPVIQMDDAPEFDFEFDDDEYEDAPEDEEERRKRFEQFMREQEEQEEMMPVQIVTQQQIDNAKESLKEETTKNQPTYISVTCEKCGKEFFVREGDVMTWE